MVYPASIGVMCACRLEHISASLQSVLNITCWLLLSALLTDLCETCLLKVRVSCWTLRQRQQHADCSHDDAAAAGGVCCWPEPFSFSLAGLLSCHRPGCGFFFFSLSLFFGVQSGVPLAGNQAPVHFHFKGETKKKKKTLSQSLTSKSGRKGGQLFLLVARSTVSFLETGGR